MHTLKKIYCRTVQIALRAALPILPYTKPVMLDSVLEVPDVLKEKAIDSVMLITDKGVRGCGLTAPLEKALEESGINCTVYDETVANPTEINVREAQKIYYENNCKALIGFGGGSPIDCAKAVGAVIAQPKKRLSKMEGVLKVHRKLPPLFAIPTTAGTGSEVTLAAVVTNSKTHHKYAISDFCLIPKYAVLDPENTRKLPRHMTSTTAIDAITHAVEAFIGRSTSKETRHDAIEAVKLIFANIDKAYNNGDDMEARKNLLIAASLAGNAFSKSYVGYVHAVAHSLSGLYNLPHGFANAVLLPKVLKIYGSAVHPQLAVLAKAAGVADNSDSDSAAAEKFINALIEMNKRFDIPEYFKELRKEDIDSLSKTADHEGNPLYPVPVLMDAEELKVIYNSVLEEK